MGAGATIAQALSAMRDTSGAMALALEVKKPVPQARIALWVKRLRSAADKLEELL